MYFCPDDEAVVEEFIRELERKDLSKTPAIEKYGFCSILRSYYGLPSSIRLNMKSQHGVCLWEEIPPSELKSKRRMMLVFSRRWAEKWRQARTGKLVIALPNPFLLYKQQNKLTKVPDAAGSVFFYAHSTANDVGVTDNEALISALLEMPEDFGECLVAMHYVDMLRGEYKAFLAAGFKVFCAGHYSDPGFVARFYQMLSNRKYALSNAIGSHYFYSIEHGLPFSYIGVPPVYRNKGYDPCVLAAIQRAQAHISESHQIENGFVREISAEQLQYVKSELGADLHMSRYKFMAMIALAAGLDGFSYTVQAFKMRIQLVKGFLLRNKSDV